MAAVQFICKCAQYNKTVQETDNNPKIPFHFYLTTDILVGEIFLNLQTLHLLPHLNVALCILILCVPQILVHILISLLEHTSVRTNWGIHMVNDQVHTLKKVMLKSSPGPNFNPPFILALFKACYYKQHTLNLSHCHDADKWDMCMCHHHNHHQVPVPALARQTQEHRVQCQVYED